MGAEADRSARGVQVAFVAVLLLLGAGCGGSGSDKAGGSNDPKVVLTLAEIDADATTIWIPDFVAAVERLSGGSLEIDVKYGWGASYGVEDVEASTIADVKQGKVDLAEIRAAAWDSVGVTSFAALLAPFLVDSVALEQRVVESPLAQRMLAGVDDFGLVGLALLPGPLRYPLGITRPLTRPSGYDGAVIGLRPSRLHAAALRALGAQPTVFVPGSIGELDGMEIDLVTTRWMRYHEQAHSLTGNVVLWPRPITFVMNRTAFEALSPRQQTALRQAGAEAAPHLLARIHDDEQALLCSPRGVRLATASDADAAALRASMRSVYAELEQDDLTRELLAEIRRLRGSDHRAGPAPPRCEDTPERRVATDPRLLGRWQARFTEQELIGAGVPVAVAVKMAGAWVMEYRRGGRWASHHLLRGAVFSGTYVTEGDVEKRTTESCRPRQWCTPGTVDEYTWSIYQDTLTFTPIPGRPYQPANVINRWHRPR